MKSFSQISTLALAFFAAISLNAQSMDNTVMVGGESMFPMKNIVENAVNSKAHTTLVAAVLSLIHISEPTRPY